MQFCPKHNTPCKLPSCKHGEEFIDFKFEADDHELTLCEMTKEQEEMFWKEGRRFFEPINPRWKVTTDKGVYVGRGTTGKIIEECEDFEGK
jgi:hypothetical protein